jgi:nucleotidyltransferase/DNA polymerase involved in DNA repair
MLDSSQPKQLREVGDEAHARDCEHLGFKPAKMLWPYSNSVAVKKEGIELTERVERAARVIQNEADRLSVMRNNSHIVKRTHQHHLQKIANEVNRELKPSLERLAEIQPDLPQWKQQAIDEMRSTAVELAANTNAAILNRNAATQNVPARMDTNYGQLLQSMTVQSERLTEIADATADYAEAQLQGVNAGLAISQHN